MTPGFPPLSLRLIGIMAMNFKQLSKRATVTKFFVNGRYFLLFSIREGRGEWKSGPSFYLNTATKDLTFQR